MDLRIVACVYALGFLLYSGFSCMTLASGRMPPVLAKSAAAGTVLWPWTLFMMIVAKLATPIAFVFNRIAWFVQDQKGVICVNPVDLQETRRMLRRGPYGFRAEAKETVPPGKFHMEGEAGELLTTLAGTPDCDLEMLRRTADHPCGHSRL